MQRTDRRPVARCRWRCAPSWRRSYRGCHRSDWLGATKCIAEASLMTDRHDVGGSKQQTGTCLRNDSGAFAMPAADCGQDAAKPTPAIAGHQTPDVSQIGTDMMGQFAATSALETVPASFQASTFFQSAWNTNIVNGTVYGVPWYVETRLLYYRTDIAQKA